MKLPRWAWALVLAAAALVALTRPSAAAQAQSPAEVTVQGAAMPAPALPTGESSDADSANALRDQFALLSKPLNNNSFQRPLVLLSTETSSGMRGDIYALMVFPFAAVSSALQNPQHWCEVMILHINTKYCHADLASAGPVLTVNIGTKTPQQLAQAARVTFNFRLRESTPQYFEVLLDAKDGPLGTSDYRIRMEAVALGQHQTFLHLTYSYSANLAAKLAMQAYLATAGADKVGFTMTNTSANGRPVFVAGVRGLVERNTMRYYLAIESYMQATPTAASAQLEQRLRAWFTGVEQYPLQLHEMDLSSYLEMKHAEVLRQQTVP
jgi:TolA-binding protein